MDEALIPRFTHTLKYSYTLFFQTRKLLVVLYRVFYFETCQQETGRLTSLVNGIFIEPVEAVREGKRLPGSIVILLLVFILDDDNATLNGTPQSGLPTMSAEEERGVVRVKVKVRNCGDRAAGRNPNQTHTQRDGNTTTLSIPRSPARPADSVWLHVCVCRRAFYQPQSSCPSRLLRWHLSCLHIVTAS